MDISVMPKIIFLVIDVIHFVNPVENSQIFAHLVSKNQILFYLKETVFVKKALISMMIKFVLALMKNMEPKQNKCKLLLMLFLEQAQQLLFL
jgi:hypothetical protein